jgi:hypothetical protein
VKLAALENLDELIAVGLFVCTRSLQDYFGSGVFDYTKLKEASELELGFRFRAVFI